MAQDPISHPGVDEAPGFRQLICYQLSDVAPAIVPAVPERQWMDATPERFSYRCLPLTIANSMGWELLLPFAIRAEWNGGPELSDIEVTAPGGETVDRFAASHFGSAVLTFQTRYLFRTEPGVALWVRGSPNRPKDGIAPLEGIVETDWLSFTFTMNWMFTRPGRVEFAKDEPYCFISPVGYHALDNITPEIRPIASDPDLQAAYEDYKKRRLDFNEKLARNDEATLQQGWQKWYFRGQTPDGSARHPRHVSKLRLSVPRKVSGIGSVGD